MSQDSEVIFKPATFYDSIGINKLNKTSLPENYSTESIIAMILSSLGTSFVATIDDNIIGYSLILIDKGKFAHLVSIAVDRAYRNQMIGKTILTKSLVGLKKLNINTIYLNVRPSNMKAIRLYEKFGFKYLDRKKQYYEDGEDGLTYVRKSQ